MKNLFVILALFMSFGVLSQSDSLPDIPFWMENSCEIGVKLAIQDAEKGNYKIIQFGLRVLNPMGNWEFEPFYNNYLFEKYNVEIIDGGCSVYSAGECYTKKMRELIIIEFGDNFFDKTRLEARNEFAIKIDTGYIFSMPDVMAEFIGGQDSLFTFLKKNIKYPVNNQSSIKGKVYCQFIVEKDGSLSNIKILRSLQVDYDNEVIRVMKLMPKWKPGKIGDETVRTQLVLPVNFQ